MSGTPMQRPCIHVILSDRSRIERGQRIIQTPMVAPSLLAAACDIEEKTENLPADILDARMTGRDTAGIDIDQIVPTLGQRSARRHLDHRDQRQAVRRSLS